MQYCERLRGCHCAPARCWARFMVVREASTCGLAMPDGRHIWATSQKAQSVGKPEGTDSARRHRRPRSCSCSARSGRDGTGARHGHERRCPNAVRRSVHKIRAAAAPVAAGRRVASPVAFRRRSSGRLRHFSRPREFALRPARRPASPPPRPPLAAWRRPRARPLRRRRLVGDLRDGGPRRRRRGAARVRRVGGRPPRRGDGRRPRQWRRLVRREPHGRGGARDARADGGTRGGGAAFLRCEKTSDRPEAAAATPDASPPSSATSVAKAFTTRRSRFSRKVLLR